MITQDFITTEKLPLVVEPENKNLSFNDFLALLEENGDSFREQLLTTGAILFRGFPVNSAHDFEDVVKALKIGDYLNYIGGDSPRVKVTDYVYTSTEAPPSIMIPLHNEMSFVEKYPTHISFYCDTPPSENGETPIADARKIYNDIDPEVRERFTEKGLKYYSRYHHKSKWIDLMTKKSHKSWTTSFETDSKEEVERLCHDCNYDFSWNRNNWIEIVQKRPGVMAHPKTGEMTWFNQCHLFDFNPRYVGTFNYYAMKLFYFRRHTKIHDVEFGDGSPIPREDIYHILDVLSKNTIRFPWRKGDVLVLDNVLTMHARESFTDRRRRILTTVTR